MNEMWVWRSYFNDTDRKATAPWETFAPSNSMSTSLGLNPGLHCERLAINHLSHDMVFFFLEKRTQGKKGMPCHVMVLFLSNVPPLSPFNNIVSERGWFIVRQEISNLNGYLLVVKLILCRNTGFWLWMPVFKARAVYVWLVEHILQLELLFFLASYLSTIIPYLSVIRSWYNTPSWGCSTKALGLVPLQ